jgi:hypothetical protein
MSMLLVCFAIYWKGPVRVDCRFQVSVAGKDLPPSGQSASVYEIPDGAAEVRVIATPTATPTPYSENTVFLTVGANGLSAKAGSEGFLVITKSTTLGDPPVTFAKVVLSWFKDVTADTLKLLSNPPSYRHMVVTDPKGKKKIWADVYQLQDPVKPHPFVSLTVAELHDHQIRWGTWPPSDWQLHNLSGTHFIDPTTPVKSGALNFVASDLQINVDSVVLQLAGVEVNNVVHRVAGADAPELFAVTWPNAIKPASGVTTPTPFLVFIEQTFPGNFYDQYGLFVGGPLAAYPNNADYAEMLFQQLHYPGRPGTQQTPFASEAEKGVPYQVAKAGVNVVTVVPLNSFEKDFGVMNRTDTTGLILQELQAFMFMRSGVTTVPATIGKTALASFSSANFVLGAWLADATNRAGDFLAKRVNAVYFLDPVLEVDPKMTDVKAFVDSAMTWSDAGTDKRIRLYMRYASSAHTRLLAKPPAAAVYVANSTDGGKRTGAVLPEESWTAALTKIFGAQPKSFVAWEFAHHMFAATMLTHALSQGDLS